MTLYLVFIQHLDSVLSIQSTRLDVCKSPSLQRNTHDCMNEYLCNVVLIITSISRTTSLVRYRIAFLYLITTYRSDWEDPANIGPYLDESEWKFGVSLARCAFVPRSPPVPNRGGKGTVVKIVLVTNVTLSCQW